MISLSRKFLFVHVPKTAGNSIQNILKDFSEDRIVIGKGQDGIERFCIESPNAPISKHSNLKAYRDHLDPKTYQSLFKFACVRNPWDQMISFYFSPHRAVSKFIRRDFIDLVKKKPTTASYLTLDGTTNGEIGVDHIMRFETLGKDFEYISEKIGIGEHHLPHRNASKRAHYSTYYDQEMIDLVAERYKRVIEMFGYTFERDASSKNRLRVG